MFALIIRSQGRVKGANMFAWPFAKGAVKKRDNVAEVRKQIDDYLCDSKRR